MAACWVLNLDADLELGARGPYSPSRRVVEAMRAHVERLAATLLGPDDVLVDATAAAASARGLRGRAFCPTPRAVAILRRAGATVDPHPPVDVLRRVNSRGFSSGLGATLPGEAFVTEAGEAGALLAGEPPLGDGWRVKHAFGMAGRNQRTIGGSRGRDAAKDLAFVRAGIARGGVQIEPNVAIVEEFAVHGVVREDASFQTGRVVRQRCDPRGAWIATEGLDGDACTVEGGLRPLLDEACRVAAALSAAGYHGPFGVDAFTYQDGTGEVCLRPRSEINARYSMGFTVGFGAP